MKQIKTQAEFLRRLKKVAGNHDWYLHGDRYIRSGAACPITMVAYSTAPLPALFAQETAYALGLSRSLARKIVDAADRRQKHGENGALRKAMLRICGLKERA